ncbi:hypothetical protein A9Q80_03855 [Cycloclasticus sp. 46_83_sub15_T18]|nr:hypothetical protein A9Q80_03855 [Cycloclasticus sp. 46_83_sub15_T18]
MNDSDQRTEGFVRSFDGTRLYSHSYQPTQPLRANLLIVHGVGEHSGRYQALLEPMLQAGVALHFYDLRGHGQSAGQRGHINAWSDYQRDLEQQIEPLCADGIPFFILGHSFGSLIVLDFLELTRRDVRGAIISSSALQPLDVAPAWQQKMVAFIARFWPTLGLKINIDTKAISRSHEQVQAYQNDPLIHQKISARWGADVLRAMRNIEAKVANIRTPILMTHGEPDWLNSSQGSKAFFERLSVEDKTLFIYPDSYHEPHNDLDSETVVRGLVEWLSQRV